MGLGAGPSIVVLIDGKPIAGDFFARLVSLTIVDRNGIQADTFQATLSDGLPRIAAPRRGAVAEVQISANGSRFVGKYVIDTVTHNMLPYTIAIKGHSADLRAGMKTTKSRHWDGKSVKEIVTQIAGEYDLETRISDAVSSQVYSWIGQQDESDLNFLRRIADRNSALFTIKSGTLLWLKRGSGETASGEGVPPAIIQATDIVKGSCNRSVNDVDRFKVVKAYFQDRAGATRVEVVVDGDPEADGEKVIDETFASEEEARRAAQSAALDMVRGLVQTACQTVGRPDFAAGRPVIYSGVRAGLDGEAFIIEAVTHQFAKSSGFTSRIEAKLQAPVS